MNNVKMRYIIARDSLLYLERDLTEKEFEARFLEKKQAEDDLIAWGRAVLENSDFYKNIGSEKQAMISDLFLKIETHAAARRRVIELTLSLKEE